MLRFSRYERRGDGGTVRSGANYHDTKEPEDFSNEVFLNHVFDALEPQPSSSINGSARPRRLHQIKAIALVPRSGTGSTEQRYGGGANDLSLASTQQAERKRGSYLRARQNRQFHC